MEKVESALDVLSRAATMVQPCPAYPASDSDSSFGTPSGESEGDRTVSPDADGGGGDVGARPAADARELTGKWRRDRRDRRLPDYRPRENGKMALRSQSFNEKRPARAAGAAARDAQPHSDGELSDGAGTGAAGDLKSIHPEHSRGRNPNGEAPIDMRLTRPAPPPYPGAGATRPSVITRGGDTPPDSVSMCDPVIDEHFRRSLGDNYMSLFKKNEAQPGPKPNTKDRASSPILFNRHADPPRPTKIIAMDVDDAGLSVDDHFAKALGDTWRQIQTSRLKTTDEKRRDQHRGGVDEHFTKALGDTWNKIKTTRHAMDAEPAEPAGRAQPTKEQATKIISRSGVVI